MRGDKTQQVAIPSAVTTEQLVPPDHPIRASSPWSNEPSRRYCPLEAWASMKSVRPRDEGDDSPASGGGGRNRSVDYRGEQQRTETHVSRTDP